MTTQTVYARKEPTTCTEVPSAMDVVFYRDAACTEFVARRPWHFSSMDHRKWAVLNCIRYRLEWAQ